MSIKMPVIIAMLATSVHCISSETLTGKYEMPPAMSAGDILSPDLLRSEYHRVLDDMDYQEHFFRFEFETDGGVEKVVSRPLLRIRVHEAGAIAEANNALINKSGMSETSGLRQPDSPDDLSAGTVQYGGVQEESIAMPQIKLSGNRKKRPGATAESGSRELPGSGTDQVDERILEAHKRAVAARLQVDAYTSNPVVQALLNKLARERAQGKAPLGSGFLMERNPETRLGRGAADNEVRRNLKDKTPEELYILNGDVLAGMGIPAGTIQRFLDHPVFTPRHRTFITTYLKQLGPIEGVGKFLDVVLSAENETDALFYEQLARVLAVYNEQVEALADLELVGSTVTAHTGSGVVVIAMPVDIVYWSRDIDEITNLAGRSTPESLPRRELVITGLVTDVAHHELEERGVIVRDHFLSKR